MKKNFKLIIEYDGTGFAGWQVQKNGLTVQGELEKAISLILNQPIRITGSGRTDAGVHAMGQVANFHANTEISPKNLLKGLNSIIKTPIVIRSCHIVSPNFHARYSALSKEYHYHILNSDTNYAVGRDYIWHIKIPLDIEKINRCCAMLIGDHDFKSFEASGSPREHTIRTIYNAQMDCYEKNYSYLRDTKSYLIGNNNINSNKHLVFKIRGSGFLRFMVRNILGTLVMVGLSRITVDAFKDILNAKDRTLAGATAPARGLFLMCVNYD